MSASPRKFTKRVARRLLAIARRLFPKLRCESIGSKTACITRKRVAFFVQADCIGVRTSHLNLWFMLDFPVTVLDGSLDAAVETARRSLIQQTRLRSPVTITWR